MESRTYNTEDILEHTYIQTDKVDRIIAPNSQRYFSEDTVSPELSETIILEPSRTQTQSASSDSGLKKERFEFQNKLGQGAFGVVWAAIDHELQRKVAVKSLLGTEDQQAKDEFLEEIRIAAKIEHSSTPSIYNVGIDEKGKLYCMMRCIDGRSLSALIKALQQGDPKAHLEYPFHRRGEIIVKLLEVLDAAHQKGIVHRDIKPDNIILTKLGEVMLLDWGIALDRNCSNGVGEFCGTPYYMSPEQAAQTEVDARSDLYSLCCVFYELLCLKRTLKSRPSIAQISTAINQAVHDPVDSVESAHQSYAPSEYYGIVHKGLSKSPNDRFKSAKEMLQELKDVQSGYIIAKCSRTSIKGRLHRYMRWLDENPHPNVRKTYATLYGTVILLIAFGMLVGWMLSSYMSG